MNRAALDPRRPYAFFNERERAADGQLADVATVFLTNRQCPWRCVMCDLWKNTLTTSVAPGDIPAQIEYALERLPPAQHIKLYNSGSFFDRGAIPPEDHPAIAGLVRDFRDVIVESHPALVGDPTLRFRDLLSGQLEVAMGLETAQESVLAQLNKGMTLASFQNAAALLAANQIRLRVFVIVNPPFSAEAEALHWAQRSLDFAFDCGASAVTLIPLRNAPVPPRLAELESAVEYGLRLRKGRVFADTWDLPLSPLRERLERMNLSQQVEPVHGMCA